MTAEHGNERATPQTLLRAQEVLRWIVAGYSRPEILQHAAADWGLSQRQADRLIGMARAEIVASWELQRPELTATLLSRSDLVFRLAIEAGNLNAAVGAIAQQARLARLG